MEKISGIILTPSDFYNKNGKLYIKKEKTNGTPGILLIHADWCGHCKRFIPTYNKIVNYYGKKIPCTSIEESVLSRNQQLVKDLNFRGFPTIKFFDQDGFIDKDHNGSRDSTSILKDLCSYYHNCVSK